MSENDKIAFRLPLQEAKNVWETVLAQGIIHPHLDEMTAGRTKKIQEALNNIEPEQDTAYGMVKLKAENAMDLLIFKGIGSYSKELLDQPVMLPLLIGDLEVPPTMPAAKLSYTDTEYWRMKECASKMIRLSLASALVDEFRRKAKNIIYAMDNIEGGQHMAVLAQNDAKLFLAFVGLCSETAEAPSLIPITVGALETIVDCLL